VFGYWGLASLATHLRLTKWLTIWLAIVQRAVSVFCADWPAVTKQSKVNSILFFFMNLSSNLTDFISNSFIFTCPVRAPGCKNWPAPFPGRMSYKVTKPGLVSVLYLSVHYAVLLFIRAPFYVSVSFRYYVFCLLVVLVKLSVLAKWLAWKTPLKKPNHDEGIISRKPRQKSAYDFLGVLYCFVVLLCICVVSCPYVI